MYLKTLIYLINPFKLKIYFTNSSTKFKLFKIHNALYNLQHYLCFSKKRKQSRNVRNILGQRIHRHKLCTRRTTKRIINRETHHSNVKCLKNSSHSRLKEGESSLPPCLHERIHGETKICSRCVCVCVVSTRYRLAARERQDSASAKRQLDSSGNIEAARAVPSSAGAI